MRPAWRGGGCEDEPRQTNRGRPTRSGPAHRPFSHCFALPHPHEARRGSQWRPRVRILRRGAAGRRRCGLQTSKGAGRKANQPAKKARCRGPCSIFRRTAGVDVHLPALDQEAAHPSAAKLRGPVERRVPPLLRQQRGTQSDGVERDAARTAHSWRPCADVQRWAALDLRRAGACRERAWACRPRPPSAALCFRPKWRLTGGPGPLSSRPGCSATTGAARAAPRRPRAAEGSQSCIASNNTALQI